MATKRLPSIEILPHNHAQLAEVEAWSQLDKKKVVNTVLVWFFEQNQDVQGSIIGSLPRARRPEFVKGILERMAQEYPTGDAVPTQWKNPSLNEGPPAKRK